MADALDVAVPGSVDDKKPDAALDATQLKARWALEIERYERKAQRFDKLGKMILKRYTAEEKDDLQQIDDFNVLWSNVQTLKPALYGRDPTPEVERRFKDKDPVGRVASDVLERCASYTIAKQGFGDTIRLAVLDRLLPGRGIAWVRYVPHLQKVGNAEINASVRTDGPEVTSAAPEDLEEVTWEEVKYDFVPWTDFGHTVARSWEEIDGVWRIVYLDRTEVTKRFGQELATKIQYDQKPDGLDKDAEGVEGMSKAKIYEIWDKRTKRAIWIHKSHATPLDVRPDPLKLENFWPCPKPLQSTAASASFIPTPDYALWKAQAAELDRLTQRIKMLTRALKVVGVYDASVPALQNLLNSGTENRLIPVDSFAAFAEKGGLAGSVELLDVSQIAEILVKLHDCRDSVKQTIYEISGMSDLLRGASDPDTTATAERIKASYGSVRLKDMQREVADFARELVRIGTQIIASQFSIDTIKAISGVKLLTDEEKQQIQLQQQLAPHMAQAGIQVPPLPPQTLELMQLPSWNQVEALLRDNAARSFRIDIETDSTIAQDERAEQEARVNFAETVGKMLESTLQVVQEVPQLAGAVAETFMFVLRSFKVGRPTESAFQEAMDKLSAMAEQPQQPKPNPEQMKAQAQIQIEQNKAQVQAQTDQARVQADMQIAQMKFQHEQQMEQIRAQTTMQVEQFKQQAQTEQIRQQNAIEAQRDAVEQARDAHLEQMRMAMEERMGQMQQTIALLVARIGAASRIEVAEITSQAALDTAQIASANQAASSES